MKYHVYILECTDGTLYTGATQGSLDERIHKHNHTKAGAKYTRARRPVTLRYSEEFDSLAAARAREAEIKRMKKPAKEELIATQMPSSRKMI